MEGSVDLHLVAGAAERHVVLVHQVDVVALGERRAGAGGVVEAVVDRGHDLVAGTHRRRAQRGDSEDDAVSHSLPPLRGTFAASREIRARELEYYSTSQKLVKYLKGWAYINKKAPLRGWSEGRRLWRRPFCCVVESVFLPTPAVARHSAARREL